MTILTDNRLDTPSVRELMKFQKKIAALKISIMIFLTVIIVFSNDSSKVTATSKELLEIQNSINRSNMEYRKALESLNVVLQTNTDMLHKQDQVLSEKLSNNKKDLDFKIQQKNKEYDKISTYNSTDIIREYSKIDSIIRYSSNLP